MSLTKEEFDKRLEEVVSGLTVARQAAVASAKEHHPEASHADLAIIANGVLARYKREATQLLRQLTLDTGNAAIGKNNPNVHNIVGIENQNNLREFQRAELREIVKGE